MTQIKTQKPSDINALTGNNPESWQQPDNPEIRQYHSYPCIITPWIQAYCWEFRKLGSFQDLWISYNLFRTRC